MSWLIRGGLIFGRCAQVADAIQQFRAIDGVLSVAPTPVPLASSAGMSACPLARLDRRTARLYGET